jgi:hypothetical protein
MTIPLEIELAFAEATPGMTKKTRGNTMIEMPIISL